MQIHFIGKDKSNASDSLSSIKIDKGICLKGVIHSAYSWRVSCSARHSCGHDQSIPWMFHPIHRLSHELPRQLQLVRII
jgi:hypothetical protein